VLITFNPYHPGKGKKRRQSRTSMKRRGGRFVVGFPKLNLMITAREGGKRAMHPISRKKKKKPQSKSRAEKEKRGSQIGSPL